MATRLGVVGAAAYVSTRAVAFESNAASAARREEPTGRRGSRRSRSVFFPDLRDVFKARRASRLAGSRLAGSRALDVFFGFCERSGEGVGNSVAPSNGETPSNP